MSEFPHNYMDRRPRKRPKLAAAAAAWDIPPQLQPRTHTKAQSGLYYGQVVGNGTSIGSSRMLPDHASLFVKGLAQKGSPPWRDDDKDGHYVFALGENLTSRCNYA